MKLSMSTTSLLKFAGGAAPFVLGFLLSRGSLAGAQPGPPLPAVVVNEIHYHPPGDSGAEFLELYNRTDAELDLHGWEFRGAVRFRFDRAKGPAAIPPRGFLVIARDPQLVARDTGLPPERVAGPFSGRLSNRRDRLALIDRGGGAVETVEYERDGAWPARADGLGPSLQRISSEAAGNLPQNWTVALDGNPREGITPGRTNSATGPLPPLVRFVERSPEEPRPAQPVTIRVRVEGEARDNEVSRLRAHTGEAARADLERWPRWGIEPRNPEHHRDVLEDYAARRSRFLRNFLLEENRTTAIEDGAGPEDGFRRFRYVPAPRMKIAAIHFRPDGGEDLEAIEVRNFEKKPVSIAGWNIPAVGYVFPEGSEAPADASFIVARRPEAWTRAAVRLGRPNGERVFGPYSGDLADDGEELRLRDGGFHDGKRCFPETIDSVKYRAGPPWPASKSPSGASGKAGRIRLRSLSLDNDLPESWRAES